MKGYKMLKMDYTDFYSGKVKYEIGSTMVHPNPDLDKNIDCGVGYHISKEPHNPMEYNASFPWRLLEVYYTKSNVIHDNGKKVRVSKLKVVKELKPYELGLPNSKRVYGLIERASKIKLKRRTRQAEKDIRVLVKKHVELLNKRHTGDKLVVLNGVKFHSIKQWDSVRGSAWGSAWYSVCGSVCGSVRDSVRGTVWDSVWDCVRGTVRYSVWDSVWGSVWDCVWYSVRDSVWYSVWDSIKTPNHRNPFLPLMEICEKGAVFYGIDKKGYAHIIMPSKDEVKEGDEQ